MSCRTLTLLMLLLAASATSGQDEPLSTRIAEGIARQFPRTARPLVLASWPTPLREAPGAMMTAAISPDGAIVATGCGHPNQAGELVLWNTTTGREHLVLRFPRGVRSIAFTKDGRQIAAGGFDGVARLIDVKDGATLREFRGHTDAINGLALSPDDRQLATGSHDDTIMLWNVADGSVAQTFKGHTGDVLTVAISNNGKLLASAGRDNTIKLWDLETTAHLHTLQGHEALVETVAFSPDSRHVASASWDGTLRLWDATAAKETGVLRRPTRMVSLAFAPKGELLAAGGFDGQLVLWDHANDAVTKQIDARAAAVYALAWSQDGTRLASCSFDGVANLWNADGTPLQTFARRPSLQGDARLITGAVWLADETLVATTHGDGIARLTLAATGQAAGEIKLPSAMVTHLAAIAGEDSVWAGTASGDVYRLSAAPAATPPGKDGPGGPSYKPSKVGAHQSPIASLALSPDGKFLASCGQNGSLQIHETAGSKTIATADTGSPIVCAAFDQSNRRLATGHADGRVRLWHARTAKEIPCDLKLDQPPQALACATAGDLLATAAGQAVTLWKVAFEGGAAKASVRRSFTLADGQFTTLAFTPDSRQIITGDQTGAIRLWTIAGSGERTLPRKHGTGVSALAVAPRTNRVLTASPDGTAYIWEPAGKSDTIEPLVTIPAHDKGARYIALTPDGEHLISDGYDNHVRVWNLTTGGKERDLAAVDTASAAVLLPKGTRIAIGRWGKRIQICDLGSGQPQENYPGLPRGPYSLAISPDESRMLAVFRELGVRLFDLTSLEADPLVTLAPDELPFTFATFSPDNAAFVTCTGDHERMTLAGKLRLHNAKNGAVIRSFDGHTSEVKYAAFDAAGKRLASCSGDKTVRLWEVESGKLLATLPHAIGTFSAAFVPESDLLFASDYHGTLLLWDLRTNQVVQQLACHSDFLGRVVLSSDLSVAATSSRDGTVKLWKLAGAGNELRVVDAAN
jgi:WD40 repeat protein